MKLLLSCEQATAVMTEYTEGALTGLPRLRLRMHLAACFGCRCTLATLEATPGLVERAIRDDVQEAPPAACLALQAALARLGEPPMEVAAPTPVPEPLRPLLQSEPDLPLRLLALAHRSLRSLLPREADPVLPQEVASELPPREAWVWQHRGALRIAELVRDAATGARLSLMFAPAGVQIPIHSHRGTESLLLLDGEMFDEQGDYQTGDWIHFEEGSRHTPVMGPEGCWCLVREEGGQHFMGPLGWLRNWLAA